MVVRQNWLIGNGSWAVAWAWLVCVWLCDLHQGRIEAVPTAFVWVNNTCAQAVGGSTHAKFRLVHVGVHLHADSTS